MQQMSEAMRNGCFISLKQQIKLMIALSVPAILEQLVTTLMGYIDTAMLGSLGYEATAAVGVVSSSIWLINGIVNAAAVGFSVQVAQYLGAGREADGRNVLCQAVLFHWLFGMGLALLVVFTGAYLPGLLGAEQSVEKYAGDYFRMIGAFLPFSMAAVMYSAIFRCSGNVLLPSLMNVGMCLLDVVFNFLLIYPTRELFGLTVWGAGLGVQGAALGTGLAQACVGLTLLFLIIRRKGPLRLRGNEQWRFTGVCMYRTWKLAAPAALERTALCLAQIVMTYVVAGMGAAAVAANYVAVQTESICYLPAYGVAAAATVLVGQSIGAGRPDMAKKFACGAAALGFLLVTVTGSVLFLGAPFLAGLLTQEQEVLVSAAGILRIVAFAEPMFAVSIVVIGALRGAGDSRGPFLINLCSMWGIRVFTILLFTRRYGIVGIWAAMAAEFIVRGTVFLIRLIRGGWLRKADMLLEGKR